MTIKRVEKTQKIMEEHEHEKAANQAEFKHYVEEQLSDSSKSPIGKARKSRVQSGESPLYACSEVENPFAIPLVAVKQQTFDFEKMQQRDQIERAMAKRAREKYR